MDTITVNKSEIAKFATVGKKLALNKNAEIELCKLLDLKDYIDGVVDEVKEQIATEAQKKYPDFKGVVGEKIKAIYRAYGDKYISSNEARDLGLRSLEKAKEFVGVSKEIINKIIL